MQLRAGVGSNARKELGLGQRNPTLRLDPADERLYPKAKGVWRDDERNGALVMDEPVVVHCYTTPGEISDQTNLAEVGAFCRRMGRETRQGEIGLVIGDEYFAIRDFTEE